MESNEQLEQKQLELKQRVLKSKSLGHNLQLEILQQTFSPVYEAVVTGRPSTQYRTVACDTFSVWITRTLQLFNKHPESKEKFEGLLTEEKSTFIFHYVIDFWNDSGAALGNALKELFIKMISYLTATLDIETSNLLFSNWLKVSLDLPYTMRAFYFMTEHLHKHVQPANFILQQKPNFVAECISNIWSRALGSVVGKSVFLVLRYNYSKDAETCWLALWQSEVINGLRDINLRKGIESYLLPNLFQISKSATIQFLSCVIKENNIPILLSTLKVAQDNAILIEPFMELDTSTNKPLLDIGDIITLLEGKTASYRIGAFQLLVSSPKLSKAVPSVVYSTIIKSLDMIFTDSDLETRNELFSYFKKFISRIKDSTYALKRDAVSLTKKNYTKFEDEIKDKLKAVEEGKQFFVTLLTYIKSCLRPGASYLRKEMSYKLLLVLIKSGLDPRISTKYMEKSKSVNFVYSLDIYDSCLIRLVIDNIMDNFEDIRHYSTDVISMAPLSLETYIDMDILESRSLTMLGDIKGKEVDSGARFFKFAFSYYQNNDNMEKCNGIMKTLLDKIDTGVAKAQENLATACISYSIQGYFAAFKFIFEIMNFQKCAKILTKNNTLDRLITQSIEVWDLVKMILQHDSPEGILLEEFQSKYTKEQELMYGKGTQVVSSYAWRSIKESSSMIDSILIVKNSPITDKNILSVGPLLLEQLATIRHRGAFSSVYPTFISCCNACTKRDKLKTVPGKWLKENLNLIKTKSNFITRRSAGIPFLLTAILSNDKSLVKPTFYQLVDVAKLPVDELDADMDNVNLPQVNAFNCIKTIFIDAALSDVSILYVDDAFALTLNSFASPYWAIRNCAVMLFTALQNRLFSSKKVKANYLPSYPARLFFEKFDSIHGLFYDTLNDAVSTGLDNHSEIEKVFPILTVMSRLEPTPGYTGLDTFIPLTINILENKTWKVREMAARSLPSMIDSVEKFENVLLSLLNAIDNKNCNFNAIHGSLLAVKELILKFSSLSNNESTNHVGKLCNEHSQIRENILTKLDIILDIDCYPIKLAYFQLLTLLEIGKSEEEVKFIDQLFLWFKNENKLSDSLDGSKQLALKALCDILLKNVIDKESMISECIFSSLYELQLSCIKFYEEQIQGTNINENIINILIESIWKLVEMKNVWKYVKSQSLQLLKHLIVNSKEVESIEVIEMHTQKLLELLETEFNEDIKLSVVEALGSYVAKLMVTDGYKYEREFDQLIENIQDMITDDLEFVVRISALRSLVAFNEIYYGNGDNERVKLLISGFIFEFLTDDDETACEIAANHLTRVVLQKGNIEMIPVEVEKLMQQKFCDIENVKLFDIFFKKGFNFYDTETKFDDVVVGDMLLFSSEKSNLERNPTDKMKELIQLIDSVDFSKNKESLEYLTIPLKRNLSDITCYLQKDTNIDGCFGLFSSERVFDFIYCQLLLFNCLRHHDVINWDIADLSLLLKSKQMHCHPLILDLLD